VLPNLNTSNKDWYRKYAIVLFSGAFFAGCDKRKKIRYDAHFAIKLIKIAHGLIQQLRNGVNDENFFS
jgi:hypothetical protein